MPNGACRWLTQSQLDALDIPSIPEDGEYGYLIETDLDYPAHLHSDASHSQLSCAAVKRAVRQEENSPYARKLQQKYNLNTSSQPKLLLTLEPKSRNTCHHKLLQLYIRQGLVVTRVPRAMRFEQCDYLRRYVEFNATLRARATNIF
jgi:hypothetical protein